MNHHSSTPITARLVLSSFLPFSFSFLFSALDLDTPSLYMAEISQFFSLLSLSSSFQSSLDFPRERCDGTRHFVFACWSQRCIANKFESFQFYIKLKRLFSALSWRGPSFSILGLWAQINESNSNVLIKSILIRQLLQKLASDQTLVVRILQIISRNSFLGGDQKPMVGQV